jgi:hypothetical protein
LGRNRDFEIAAVEPDAAGMVLANRAVKLAPEGEEARESSAEIDTHFGRKCSICSAMRNYLTTLPPGRSKKPTASAPHTIAAGCGPSEIARGL